MTTVAQAGKAGRRWVRALVGSAGPPRLIPAARTGVCTGLAVAVGVAADRPDWGLVAVLGCFTSQYAPRDVGRRAALMLTGITLSLSLAVLVAGLLGPHHFWAVVCTAVGAAITTVLVPALAVPPPGMSVIVIATAVATGLPSGHTARNALLVLASGCGCVVIAVVETAVRTVLLRRTTVTASSPRLSLREWWEFHIRHSPALLMAARVGGTVFVAGVLANAAASALGTSRPYWAMAAAAAAMGTGSHGVAVRTRVTHYLLGSCAGVAVAAAILFSSPDPYLIAVLLASLMFGAEFVVIRSYAIALVFITPLALLIAHTGRAEALPGLVTDRLLETAIGCTCALLASLVITKRWAQRQLTASSTATLHAINATLAASPTSLDRELHALCLHSSRLDLVRSRVSGERRAVRSATASALQWAAQVSAQAADLVRAVSRTG
ncbi:FUSC family protein [Actinocrispum sp. NPDC049592]|uniref:FUSC family protein n=1 Tax=Actinocrispum sp. NPDC049592 TaxID=3154835 RepID=UPI0034330462